jgi:hypothetical protein
MFLLVALLQLEGFVTTCETSVMPLKLLREGVMNTYDFISSFLFDGY